MSKNKLPEQNNPEEVDLGLLFKYFEKVINKIGNLFLFIFRSITWILKKAGILLLFSLSVAKKHVIKILIAGILTFLAFSFLDYWTPIKYQSGIIIKQNYNTGQLLYNNINKYDGLAYQSDSIGLSQQLGISQNKAADLVKFEIKDFMNENYLRTEYYNFIKTLDSTLILPFVDFKSGYDLENYPLQLISVTSKSKDAFVGLSEPILKSLEYNDFFIAEKEKEIALTKKRVQAAKEKLIQADSLKNQYVDLLKKYYGSEEEANSSQTTLNINMSNNKEKIETKEYLLFEVQNSARLDIADLESKLLEKERIVRLQKDFTPPIKVKSFYDKNKTNATLLVMGIVLIFYVIREFRVLDLIEEYGNKERLLEN